jgi:cytochrome c
LRLTYRNCSGKICGNLRRAPHYDERLVATQGASREVSLTSIVDPDKTGVALVRHCNHQITDRPVTNLRVSAFAAMKLLGLALLGSASSGSFCTASAQDAALGEKVFIKCKACHQIGEGAKNAVGPVLNGIVGRKAGTYADYSYSDSNKNSGFTWDEATLTEYLKNPRVKVPGTKMIFPGLPKDEDISNVIAYLKQFGADGKKS